MAKPPDRQAVVTAVFSSFDVSGQEEMTAIQLQILHERIRMGGISLQQTEAAIKYACAGNTCSKSELIDVLKEMDRRYFLIQHLRWEFSFLDTSRTDVISEELAKWFLQSVHGRHFSLRRWNTFVAARPVPGSGVSFSEIEVELCNIPCAADLQLEEEAELRRAREREERRRMLLEKERLAAEMLESESQRRRQLEQQRRLAAEEARRRQGEEDEARRMEQARREQAEREALEAAEQQRLAEAKRQEEERERQAQEEEEKRERQRKEQEAREQAEREAEAKLQKDAMDAQAVLQAADTAQIEAEEAMRKAQELQARAADAEAKLAAEQAELEAQRKLNEMKELKIRTNVKIGIREQKRRILEPAYRDFKKAKLQDYDGDLPKAENVLKLLDHKEALLRAMDNRSIPEIESAMAAVKKSGLQADLASEMTQAAELLFRLRRLERIRAEILELKQSTVAEIRSYQSPPPIVHAVMTATFLILGHKEKETKEWKTVQALVGKTGKDGLKRRCLECDPSQLAAAGTSPLERAKEILSSYELDDVRDVSAGAATFFLWATNIIEEAQLIARQKESGMASMDTE